MSLSVSPERNTRDVLPFLVFGAAFISAGLVFAQPTPIPVTVIVDERGVGTITTPTGTFPLPGVMAPDPGPGGLASALTYSLGIPGLIVIPGDVLLAETVGTTQVISDLIRFNNPLALNPSLVFYSDASATDPPEPGDLADTGLPTGRYTNLITLNEVDLGGGFAGAIYTPTPNQPGYITADVPVLVTYRIYSEIPGLGAAAILGLGGVLAARRRR